MNSIYTIKKGWLFALAFGWLLSMTGFQNAVAQEVRTVVVEPTNDFGDLNEAIDSDTTETGERVDPNTVYVLKRDAVYILDGSLQNRDYFLHLAAEEGEGHPPVIFPGVMLDGSSQRIFNVRGDVKVEGIYFSHIDEIGAKKQNMFRVRSGETRIEIDNSWLEWETQSFIRYDNSDNDIFITNSVFRNAGQRSNPGNGRWFDTRGNNTDTVFVENNTFYNQSMYFHRMDGAIVNYFHVNHNTIFNGGYNFPIGRTLEANITNNLIMNHGFRGDYGTGEPISVAEPDSGVLYFEAGLFEADSIGQLEDFSDEDRIINLRNNNLWVDVSITDLINEQPDTLYQPLQRFNPTWQGYIDSEIPNLVIENNFEEELNFNDAPESPLDWMAAHFEDPDTDVWFQAAPDARTERSTDSWHDFTYNTDAESYTAGDDGFPLGDLNWFPELKAQWEAGEPLVSTESEESIARDFRLVGNYPNPFNPTTNIVYELASQANVTMEVFNILGQKVESLNMGRQARGIHEFTYDASRLSGGVYIVRMKVDDTATQTLRITLIK
ncbi:MAG: T9SS type A sorting domain-containing protein [Balneolaceae bacterium]